jgi:thymidylate synthase ThyX
MKTTINAKIVAHSVNTQGDELISVLATFPRIILAEVNTHRMLSKNTSSSRAIPFAKMVESVQNDTFIPIAWQKAHSGMQGTEYFEGENVESLKQDWLRAREQAISSAKFLTETGVTKQLANRLLEPFMWTTMLITGPKSGWDNFFNLRCPQYVMGNGIFKSAIDLSKATGRDWNIEELRNINKGQAEIHIMDLAEKIYDAYNESTPRVLRPGEWHIPFKDKIEYNHAKLIGSEYYDPKKETFIQFIDRQAVKVSTAMAARTSYTVVGEEKAIDYEVMIGLHDRLLAQDPPHSSPLEHCARAMSEDEYRGNIKGKINLINDREFQTEFAAMTGYTPLSGACEEKALGWCNNFKGFIPYRYIVDNVTKM